MKRIQKHNPYKTNMQEKYQKEQTIKSVRIKDKVMRRRTSNATKTKAINRLLPKFLMKRLVFDYAHINYLLEIRQHTQQEIRHTDLFKLKYLK